MLKSKFFLGALVLAGLFVAVLGVNTAAAQSCSITMTLRVGSKGAEVMCLQAAVGATQDGSFGPMTAAAVKAWQSAHGLTADGVFGPMSRAAWMASAGSVTGLPAGCTSTTGFSTTTGQPCSGSTGSTNLPAGCTTTAGFSPTTGQPCSGSSTSVNLSGAGSISADGLLGGFASTVVGTGDVNHQVAGFQLTGAGGGSDLKLSSATVSFIMDPASSGTGCTTACSGSSRLSDYFSSVSLYQGSTLIGSVPASAFSSTTVSGLSNYVYSASVPLTNAVVKAGIQNNFYVAVSANASLDSGNFTHNKWYVQVSNMRYTDGTGATLVYSPTTAFPTTYASDPSFSFGSTATANNYVLNISRAGSDQNSHTVTVTANGATTQKVPLLQMVLTSQGGQAIAVNKIPVTFTPNTGSQVYKQTGEVYLMNGSTVLDSEAVPSTGNCATNSAVCTITFRINSSTPLIVTSPVTLTVAADINSVTGGGYTAGDSMTVQTATATGSNYDLTANTPNGTELITGGNDATIVPGVAVGQAVAFFATGISVNVADDVCTAQQAGYSGGHSVMTCLTHFSVTANGAPMYIPQASSTVASNANTINFVAQLSGTGNLTSGTPATRTLSATFTQNGQNASSSQSGAEWTIPAGVTANFTGTIIIDDTTSVSPGLYRAFLNDVKYGTASSATTWGNSYTFNLGSTNPVTPGYAQLN